VRAETFTAYIARNAEELQFKNQNVV